LAQEGYKGFEFFSDNKTWPHIISNHYCFNFKKVNPETRFNASQHMSFFIFHFSSFFYIYSFALLSFLFPRLPSRVFNLVDFHYLTAPRVLTSTIWPTERNLTFFSMVLLVCLSRWWWKLLG